jgi:hypothetical protein
MVKDQGWPVFGTVVVAFLIAFFAGIVFILIADSIANGPIVRIVFSALASTITAPIEALVASVLYFRLLEIKGAQAPPQPASVPQQPGDGLG